MAERICDAAVWEQQRAAGVGGRGGNLRGVAAARAARVRRARWLGAAGLCRFRHGPAAPCGRARCRSPCSTWGRASRRSCAPRTTRCSTTPGPAFGPQADSGNRVIVPFLRAAGISRLDGMIVSHDRRRSLAAAPLRCCRRVPVDWLLTSLPDLDPLMLQAEPALRCFAGQRWEWDGVRFEILHPARASYDDPALRDQRPQLRAEDRRRPAGGCSAARRHREPFGSGAGERAGDALQGRHSARAAPRQQDLIDARVPGGGEAAARRVSGRLSQPLRPPAPGCRRALRSAREPDRTAPTAMAP